MTTVGRWSSPPRTSRCAGCGQKDRRCRMRRSSPIATCRSSRTWWLEGPRRQVDEPTSRPPARRRSKGELMAELPEDRRYTAEHEWARADDGRIVVGITDHAQDQLGDIVFVGLPEPGTAVEAGKPLGEVESTKSVSDIYSPVTGTIV